MIRWEDERAPLLDDAGNHLVTLALLVIGALCAAGLLGLFQ